MPDSYGWSLLGPEQLIELADDPSAGWQLTAQSGVSDSSVRLIESTRFGGKGLRYRRLGVRDQLRKSPRCVSLVLTHADSLIGTYLLNPVDLRTSQRHLRGVYRSTLCVAERYRGQGFGRILVTGALAWLDTQAQKSDVPLISFGCIERHNHPSLALLQDSGSCAIGNLETQMVYRQWPRPRQKFTVINAFDDPRVVEAQNAASTGLAFATPQQPSFHAVFEGQSLVAGAHVHRCRLDFERIGQPWDFLSDHVFAHIGAARRRFDPRNFTYLKLDGVVVTPGYESVWKNLLSTLLAQYDTHMAMFSLDPRAATSQQLRALGVFGRVARATKQQLSVQACSHGASRMWPQDLLAECSSGPLGIGPIAQ